MCKLFIKFMMITFILLSVPFKLAASGDGGMAVIDGIIPISISNAAKLLGEDNIYFLNANTQEVVENYGSISGSIYINTEKWETLLPEDKNAVLIFYCLNRTCYASSEAAFEALKMGYNNVFVMLEGIEQWIIMGHPVEKIKIDKNILQKHHMSMTDMLIKNSTLESWFKSTQVTNYTDGIHHNIRFGAIPACRDCHGAENEIKAKSALSKISVNNNCALCHKDQNRTFYGSAHSMDTNPKETQPVCSDCHSVHTTKTIGVLNAKQLSDDKCGSCHKKEQKRYHETFHGKAMVLNVRGDTPSIAACFDCHGTHNILKSTDSKSTLYGEARIKTCAECHKNSNSNFANFIAHADHADKTNYPQLYYAYMFMTGLVVFVFAFFGAHTLFWSIRLFLTRLKHPAAWKKMKEAIHKNEVKIRRFTLFQKIQHFFMAVSFLGLSFTGLPQKFYTAPWAQKMIDFMGGPIATTKLHHIFAVIMITVFLAHIAEFTIKGFMRKDSIRDTKSGKLSFKLFLKALFGPESLMPRIQDFKDFASHVKWFFGKGERPQFDRWTYWEKFDYLAVFWGMFVIGLSGLVMWFPTFFTMFLPGWMLNLAAIVHSDEALLATGFIFAVHFFNTHFRADRFPMDTVIFSGFITEEEMKIERVNWYNRLKNSGKFESLLIYDNNFDSYKKFAKLIGFIMLFTGLILLFLIIYAYIAR
jgi:cytochrome b subunit of formate dehydrogenase/rhodanese-related sulfurtransferase